MPLTKISFDAGSGVLSAGSSAVDSPARGAEHFAVTGERGPWTWTDVVEPVEDDLSWLQTTFNFHPLTIDDCRHFDQRAKVQDYGTYLFITMAIPRPSVTTTDMEADELHAFLGPDYLVTVHDHDLHPLERIRQRILGETPTMKASPDYLLYLIANELIDEYFPILDEIEEMIGTLEDEIVAQPDRDTLNRIFGLKQKLVYLRRTAGPERELFYSLSGRRFALILGKTDLYFRDLYDHMVHIYEGIETSRDLLSNALDAYLSVVSNRLNEVMRRLTVIATIFMPLSFLVGFGGMNFKQLPFDSGPALVVLITAMVLTPVTMMIWFWRKGWA
jgi:magnesium transporter